MVSARGTGGRGRAAIAEFGTGRIAKRPTTHCLFQLDDRHPQRHRHDDALEDLRVSFGERLRGDRECGRAPRNPRRGRGQARRRGAMRRWRRRRAPGTRAARARRFGAARQAKPMNLSDHSVAAKAMAEQTRDLACALALHPVLRELLDPLIRPRHCRPVRRSQLAKTSMLTQNQTPAPDGSSLDAPRTGTRPETAATTSRGPGAQITLLVESRKSLSRSWDPVFPSSPHLVPCRSPGQFD
jgi:hypothetical protein